MPKDTQLPSRKAGVQGHESPDSVLLAATRNCLSFRSELCCRKEKLFIRGKHQAANLKNPLVILHKRKEKKNNNFT